MKHLLLRLTFLLAIWLCSALCATAAAAAAEGSVSTRDNNAVSEGLFSTLDELARIVDITYCVGTTGIRKPFKCLGRCGEFDGFELVKTWRTGPLLSDSAGFLALSHAPWPKRIIVGFRGTYSLANVAVDLAALPQPYTPYNNTLIDDDADDSGNDGSSTSRCVNCTVHTGFLASWYNARHEILSPLAATRAQFPDYALTVVGHSLGGAVAALAGLEFSSRGWTPHVTTFGEPRIGNAALARFINDRFGLGSGGDDDGGRDKSDEGASPSFRRVTHANDPVPLLPFGEWGYAPHAGEVYISKVDLPPDVADVRTCRGNNDPACIAGSDADEDAEAEAGALIDIPDATDDGPATTIGSTDSEATAGNPPPAPLASDADPNYQNGGGDDQNQPQIPLSRRGVPRRLQLWELFFAHRDYFWRLGVCLPSLGEGAGKDENSADEGESTWWSSWRPWDGIKRSVA